MNVSTKVERSAVKTFLRWQLEELAADIEQAASKL